MSIEKLAVAVAMTGFCVGAVIGSFKLRENAVPTLIAAMMGGTIGVCVVLAAMLFAAGGWFVLS